MYYALSLLTGVLISVMVLFNGRLTERYGLYAATVIIHIVGLALITFISKVKRERLFTETHAWFLYLGGFIGVSTTVMNNFAFGRISVSAIMALMLFGQSVAGLVFDQYGLLGMPKHPFTKQKLVGLTLILAGIVSMVNNFEVPAMVFSFIAGATIVLSRTLNAKLADLTSVRVSTFYNYLTGLLLSVPVFLLLGRNEIIFTDFTFSANWYIYLGGALGVCVVLLSNITVMKISSFYLTLLIFVGQVFAGVIVDMVLSQAISTRIIIGGVLVTAGLCTNLLLDKKNNGIEEITREDV
jgi:transporter family-2 protein